MLHAAVFVILLAAQSSTSTIASGLNRPTWVDVDVATGDVWVVDRGSNALLRIHGGVISPFHGLNLRLSGAPAVSFDFGGAFGGGLALEPPSAGCGGGEYGPGFYVSNSAAKQIVLGAFNSGSPVLANRDLPGILNGPFETPAGIALSWNYARGSYLLDAVYVADSAAGVVRRYGFQLSFEACPQPAALTILAAGFVAPRGLAAALDGSVYVADSGDHTIRRILSDGSVSLIAGEPGVAGADDRHLNTPSGIAVNGADEVFIADTGNAAIRKLSRDGTLTTVAGTLGVPGFLDGTNALFNGPVGIRLFGDVLYVADTSNNAVRRIVLNSPPIRRHPAK